MPKACNHVLVEELQGEYVLFNQRSQKIYRLEGDAARVAQYCDGHTPRDEVAQTLYPELDAAEAQDRLETALLVLEEQDLLQPAGFSPARREFLKKAAAFAVVSSSIWGMSAPPAAQAQSAGGGNQPPPDGPPPFQGPRG